MALNIDEKAYQETSSNPQEFDALPAGNYIVVVEGAEVRANKSGNGVHLALKLRVQGGAYRNRVIFLNQVLANNPTSLRYLKNALDACGYTHGVNELDRCAPSLVDEVVAAKVTHYKDRENVTLSRIAPALLERIQAVTMQVATEEGVTKEEVLQWFRTEYGDHINAASWIAVKEAILAGEFYAAKADEAPWNAPLDASGIEDDDFYF